MNLGDNRTPPVVELFLSAIGQQVMVETVSGKLEGILSAISEDSVGLESVSMLSDNTNASHLPRRSELVDSMIVLRSKIITLSYYVNEEASHNGFTIDQEYHESKDTAQEKMDDFEEWQDDEQSSDKLVSLDDIGSDSKTRGWTVEDMFKQNVKSDFREDLSQYRTAEPQTPQSTDEAQRVERIIKEIKNSSKSRHNERLENDDEERDLDKLTTYNHEKVVATENSVKKKARGRTGKSFKFNPKKGQVLKMNHGNNRTPPVVELSPSAIGPKVLVEAVAGKSEGIVSAVSEDSVRLESVSKLSDDPIASHLPRRSELVDQKGLTVDKEHHELKDTAQEKTDDFEKRQDDQQSSDKLVSLNDIGSDSNTHACTVEEMCNQNVKSDVRENLSQDGTGEPQKLESTDKAKRVEHITKEIKSSSKNRHNEKLENDDDECDLDKLSTYSHEKVIATENSVKNKARGRVGKSFKFNPKANEFNPKARKPLSSTGRNSTSGGFTIDRRAQQPIMPIPMPMAYVPMCPPPPAMMMNANTMMMNPMAMQNFAPIYPNQIVGPVPIQHQFLSNCNYSLVPGNQGGYIMLPQGAYPAYTPPTHNM